MSIGRTRASASFARRGITICGRTTFSPGRDERLGQRAADKPRERNAQGRVIGRKIEPGGGDGASDWLTGAEKARKLLQRDKVACIFGCYTSASLKAVLPIMEQDKGLLYYPTYYEGLEQFCTEDGSCFSRDTALKMAPGYDNMTGLGSPGAGFVSALSAP